MNKYKFALIAGILAIGLVAASIVGGQTMTAAAQQQIQQAGTEQPTISTNGSASVDVQPDRVRVTIGVETNGETAAEAAEKNAEIMERVLATLRALGVSDSQMATGNYNIFPVYETRDRVEVCIMIYPPPPECLPKNEIAGYKATNSVMVTVDTSFDVGRVIDAAVQAGANNVSGAYFFVSQERQQEIRDSLIGEAIANAKNRADRAAGAVGMQVVGVKSINLSDVFFPIHTREFSIADMTASTPILPGQQQVTMNVHAVFTMG